jgi:hypothetical protein
VQWGNLITGQLRDPGICNATRGKQCRNPIVSVQWETYLSSIDILLFSVQRGINHYIDTIAESLGFYGTLLAAFMNNAENVEVTVQWETDQRACSAATCLGNEILAIEKSLVLQYNRVLLTI